MKNWLYDPRLSYSDNLKLGPFDNFKKQALYKNKGEPQYDFFGVKVYSPFGIAAGPLPKAKFIASALSRDFDIVTFKTVRTREYPCHPNPNVIPLNTDGLDSKSNEAIKTKNDFDYPLTIANSFGIPSFEPKNWQKEIKESFNLIGKGQALLTAFQGTIDPEGRSNTFINDHINGVGKLIETGAKVIEVNLSCPNEGHINLVCFDLKTTKEIVREIKINFPKLKLIIKIAYMNDGVYLKKFVKEIGRLVDGITAINTIPKDIISSNGAQAFPGGPSRLQAGVSGSAIKHLAVGMVKRLKKYRQEFGYDFKIIGVGGVMNAQDFHDHRAAGADFVMGLTGVMWNPNLAIEIKEMLKP